LRARQFQCAQPRIDTANGAELRQRHYQGRDGGERNRNAAKSSM
jgi:hypothetical protein